MHTITSSRERLLAALDCQQPDHPSCSFMIFGALHRQSNDYFYFIEHQLAMGLDAFVMVPPRPPQVQNDTYDLYGLPVSYHPQVTVSERVEKALDEVLPVMIKTYHTPAGDLTTRVRQTEDWRWGNHVPFLDDYLIPRSQKFLDVDSNLAKADRPMPTVKTLRRQDAILRTKNY